MSSLLVSNTDQKSNDSIELMKKCHLYDVIVEDAILLDYYLKLKIKCILRKSLLTGGILLWKLVYELLSESY